MVDMELKVMRQAEANKIGKLGKISPLDEMLLIKGVGGLDDSLGNGFFVRLKGARSNFTHAPKGPLIKQELVQRAGQMLRSPGARDISGSRKDLDLGRVINP